MGCNFIVAVILTQPMSYLWLGIILNFHDKQSQLQKVTLESQNSMWVCSDQAFCFYCSVVILGYPGYKSSYLIALCLGAEILTLTVHVLFSD